MAYLAFVLGIPAVTSVIPADSATLAAAFAPSSLRLDAGSVLSGIAVAIAAAAVSSTCMLLLLQYLAGFLIKACFFLAMAASAIAAAALLSSGLLAPGIIAACLFLLTAVWYWCVRHRIEFAAAHVDVAVTALKSAPTLICVALGALLVQGAWGIMWGFAAMGAGGFIAPTSNSTAVQAIAGGGLGGATTSNELRITAVFFLLLSFFWVSMLIKDVVAFCAASVVGDWWFRGASETHPVAGALRRSLTTSCGTLSLSALLVAVVQAARALYNAALKNAKESGELSRNPLLCLASCLCSACFACATWIIQWANSWAVVFAALTGQAFRASGTAAFTLFKSRGWEAVVNQDLVAVALRIAAVVSACVGALAGGLATYALLGRGGGGAGFGNRAQQAAIAGVLCFFVGAAMSSVLTSVLLSSTRAVFAAWAMSPGALAATHPGHLAKLAAAWEKFHPEAWRASGFHGKLPEGGGGGAGAAKAIAGAVVVANPVSMAGAHIGV